MMTRSNVPRRSKLMTPKIQSSRTLEKQFLELQKLRKQVEELERVADQSRGAHRFRKAK